MRKLPYSRKQAHAGPYFDKFLKNKLLCTLAPESELPKVCNIMFQTFNRRLFPQLGPIQSWSQWTSENKSSYQATSSGVLHICSSSDR